MNQLNSRRFFRLRRKARHPLALTALFTLRQALLQEKYEECQAIITIAKEFGAKEFEINLLLEDARRLPLY